MTVGPIDFGEESKDDMPPTEYGGTHGLIQPEFMDAREAHSELTPGEKHGVVVRYGSAPLDAAAAWTGELVDQQIVDPLTGRLVDPADLKDASHGSDDKPLSALKP